MCKVSDAYCIGRPGGPGAAPGVFVITTQPQIRRYPHAELLDGMSSVKLVVKKRCGANGMLTVFEAMSNSVILKNVILQKYILPNLSLYTVKAPNAMHYCQAQASCRLLLGFVVSSPA